MSIQDDKPLTREQVNDLKTQKENIPLARARLERAKNIGMDMSAQEIELNRLEQEIDKLLAEFGDDYV